MNRSATLSRSVSLFQAFLHEQDDPERFYSVLAADSVAQLSRWVDLAGTTVLDVGGGPGDRPGSATAPSRARPTATATG